MEVRKTIDLSLYICYTDLEVIFMKLIETTVKVSSKYQVVIPKEVREELGIKPGEKLYVMIRDDGTIMFRRPPQIEDLIGLAKGMSTDNIREKEDRF